MITVAARENVHFSNTEGAPGRPGNSTIRWAGGLVAHPEQELEDETTPQLSANNQPLPEPRRVITPSLATLEKAVSARIFFENLYFPLLRQPPSREQRRLAMEKDMLAMRLSEPRKEELRARWRQNETDYLREQRRKVDVSAFIKLKTIGHGEHAY
jgi:protein-serine/threonine kinase